MPTAEQIPALPKLISLKVTKLEDRAAYARSRKGVIKALEGGFACANFTATLQCPDGRKIDVNGSWHAKRNDYGDVFFQCYGDSENLSKDYPGWNMEIDATVIHDQLCNEFLKRFPVK